MGWLSAAVAGAWDALTGEIPDHLTIPAIGFVLLYVLLFTPERILEMLIFGLGGYLLYRFGSTGGGDVLLILAITPFIPLLFPLSHYYLFLAALTLTMSFYGFYYKFKEGWKWVAFLPFLFPPVLTLLAGVLLMATVDRSRFVKEVPVEELKVEDVLAEEVEGFPKKVIERGDVERLRSMGIERVKILVGLPRMGPFIFLGLVLMDLFVKDPAFLLNLAVRVPALLFL